jgi:23S rRNA pseudouridine2605 synthase
LVSNSLRQNRVVRSIFEKLGYKVNRLDRVYFAGLTKKGLPRGKYRFLNDREVNMLKMGAYEYLPVFTTEI